MSDPVCRYCQLHLGLGAFHRAHQAAYLQDLHDLGENNDWYIASGNIRPDSGQLITNLIAQQGGYTLETVSPTGQRNYGYIQSIKKVIPWEPKLAALIDIAASPDTRIISFTVTEAGYYFDHQDRLQLEHPDIAGDLRGDSLCTIYGAIATMLKARVATGAGPVTLLNCDNLQENGSQFFDGFLQFLNAANESLLSQWCRQNVTTPNSMVDRITPRSNSALRDRVWQATQRHDQAAVMSESYCQWVIEDNFIAGKPAWERVGVQMVEDVSPYETIKIRILNASHSGIAWAGALRGYAFIHQGLEDEAVRRLAYDFITHDVIPCLRGEGVAEMIDLECYRDTVLERFSNPWVLDTNQRVAMDGFAKIPGFILPTVENALCGSRKIAATATMLAVFLLFLHHLKNGNIAFKYEDQVVKPDMINRIVQADDSVFEFVTTLGLVNAPNGKRQLTEAIRAVVDQVWSQFGSTGVLR